MKSSTFNLNVPWGHIAAKSWGNIEDTKVLMVHGYLDNAGSFNRLVALLPKNFYYVSIDLPGHGLSSHFHNGMTLTFINYLLAIRYVLDELKWEHANYIGHSFGAQLGFFFSLVYPNKIKKLILIDGIATNVVPNDQILSRIRLEHDNCTNYKKSYKYTKEQIIYALQYLRSSFLKLEAAEVLFERSVMKVGENSYIYRRDTRLKDMVLPLFNIELQTYLLTQIKVETLVIVVPNTLLFQQDLIPICINILKNCNNVNIIKVKGNHDVHNNNPENISEHISRFLTYVSSKL